ncbi:putative enzyme related to lactoylglutathione lyase [Streptacidiphilus sp. MAP12-33]|uniref:VOC family protein n=1 Tax=Streptacidiphilus sp. MAP12-33 TaxID=3156266 RepID=UPI003511F515
MTESLRLPQGTPCWVSLMAHDLDAASAYYADLLGWEFQRGPGRLGPYVRATVNDLFVAGIGQLNDSVDFPVEWITYFAVDSADEIAGRVRDCGGTVALGPMDSVDDAGRLVIAADPAGAVFGLWQPRVHYGWQLRRAPGSVVWSELRTPSPLDSSDFYAKVFGLAAVEAGLAEIGHEDGAILLRYGGHRVAGIREAGEDDPRPRWRVYFSVADLEASVKTAVELGGCLEYSPPPARYGTSVFLRDPQGGQFALVRLAEA